MSPEAPAALWRGRIAAGLDPRAARLNDSLPVDRVLWPEELALARAYAGSLVECGVLDGGGQETLLAACDALERDLESGRTVLAGEDVHTAVETELVRRAGEPALRLHTGRSRNDQVSTLLRLRVMSLCDRAIEGVKELERALVSQARAAGDRAMAAQTHLQPAQPVLLAHFWLAHVAALERDEQRFTAARRAAAVLPLGAGAIAGSPLDYDREVLALRLGFEETAQNSIDAVGDRDFALVYLQSAAALGVHLSRLAEDVILGCSPGFGWFRPGDGFATGSSLLPQKRNPDLFELARAKSARLLGNAERLGVLLQALPSGYQKDLQEDKEAVFDTAETLDRLLAALPPAVASLTVRDEALGAALVPELFAADLVDDLVEDGVPFRRAHEIVGRLWAAAEEAGVAPEALPEALRLELSPRFTVERLGTLEPASGFARRDRAPGTGPASVARQLARAEARLGIGPPPDEPATTAGSGTAASEKTRACRVEDGGGDRARRARLGDVPAILSLMAAYVHEGSLLARPIGELYRSVREFRVIEHEGRIVACAALRILWSDLGEVRSLAVDPEHHGRGAGRALVRALLADARALGLPQVIALTKEVSFFERCGFRVVDRERLPRKVWTDCVQCPKRHACDEVGVLYEVNGVEPAPALVGRPSVAVADAQAGV